MTIASIKRRDFISLLGSAAASPLVSLPLSAQQQRAPVIGLLSAVSLEAYADRIADIRQGLKQAGFVEGQNLTIHYLSANGEYDRLPVLAEELVHQKVELIIAIATSLPARATKAVTSTMPIIFAVGGDPVATGLVASLNRPGANVTGVSMTSTQLGPKRLEILRQLVPAASSIGILLNPNNPAINSEGMDFAEAARTTGAQIFFFNAGSEREIEPAFAAAVQQRVAALVISNDAFLNTQRDQIVASAARNKLPAIYGIREAIIAGGLISYGPNMTDMYHHVGIYTGRILKGEKPGDLPVMQPTKFELVINLKAAKALRLDVPPTLLALADEVME
jgi:putative ABC transport system substrate-binding protein